jgi:hypothetical protein
MGRSRTAPLLATGAALLASALLVVVIPGVTARSGALKPAVTPGLRAHLPWSTALRTPALSSSPVPTTTAARGPVNSPRPADWGPPDRFEPPAAPESGVRYALPVPVAGDGWGPPKSTGPPGPAPERVPGWATGRRTANAHPVDHPMRQAAVPPAARPQQAIAPLVPFAAPGDSGSDGYLVIGAVLLLAGSGLIVLARGIEAARPRRRRRGAHRPA